MAASTLSSFFESIKLLEVNNVCAFESLFNVSGRISDLELVLKNKIMNSIRTAEIATNLIFLLFIMLYNFEERQQYVYSLSEF
mmetsp:Transcript_6939/g.6893  ORF Transcript_6939/g.6893 Transcript_6939/m.6893 type:complete len:83 (+) Transcript_6939:507-755(+)